MKSKTLLDTDQSVSILIADDEANILSLCHEIFKNSQYKLFLASSGFEALEKARKYKIDLAFIDMKMPEMNGLETLERWKKIQPSTQIVMISAYSDDSLVRQALKKGAYTYLFKPISILDILSVTVKCLQKNGSKNVIAF